MPERPLVSIGYVEDRFLTPVNKTFRDVEEEMVSAELDTQPLEKVFVYLKLVADLEVVKLRLRDDLGSDVFSQSFQTNELREVLRPDVKDFLEIDLKGRKNSFLTLSVYHEDKKYSWLALEQENRKIFFVFDNDNQTVSGILLDREHSGWKESKILGKETGLDAHRLLERTVTLTTSVNGPRAA